MAKQHTNELTTHMRQSVSQLSHIQKAACLYLCRPGLHAYIIKVLPGKHPMSVLDGWPLTWLAMQYCLQHINENCTGQTKLAIQSYISASNGMQHSSTVIAISYTLLWAVLLHY
jgi:hypothetical protein